VCGCASKLSNPVLGRRDHEIYWCTGRDGQRVLMKWHSLANGNNRSIGGYAEAFDPVSAIRYLDSDADFLNRYTDPSITGPYRVRGAFGFGWDALDRKTGQPYLANEKDYPFTEHFHVIAPAQSTAERQVIVSNEEDFFRDFEKTYGANLPSESVTYGNEWELYAASMAETSARVRRAVEKLRTAELMATLVSLQKPDFLRGHERARDLAFTDLGLYWEHDWTADGPVSRARRAAWQDLLASDIEAYVDALHADAATQLGALIARPDSRAQRFFALNPLSWARTDGADFAYSGSRNIHVRDLSTGLDVPHQFVNLGGVTFLRVLAQLRGLSAKNRWALESGLAMSAPSWVAASACSAST
jgi:alpha-mannosidase